MKCNHEILVAAVGFAGKSTCIISVQFANRFHYDMEIICAWKGWDLLLLLFHFELGRTDYLTGLQ